MINILIILCVTTGFFAGTCIVLTCWYCKKKNETYNETYDEIIPVTKSPLNNVVIKNDYVQVI
jgi:5-methylcytosine-specific restriction endonuclease McrA